MSLLLVEGWTERIEDQLFSDGVVQDLTGASVELVAFNSAGTLTLLGTSGISDEATGKVYFDPDPTDLAKGRLKTRWKVTDGFGKISFFPNAVQPEVWIISKA